MIKAYSDGACKKSRIGGWGCAYFSTIPREYPDTNLQVVYQKYGGKKETTNQEMELTAMLELLKMLNCDTLLNNCITIVVYSDSMYTLNGIVKDALDGEYFIPKEFPNSNEGGPTGWTRGWSNPNLPQNLQWKTANGQPVKYKELWIEILKHSQSIASHYRVYGTSEDRGNNRRLSHEKINLKFQWVKGHSDDEGNDIVDRLANMGCEMFD